jgi:hypothetical protein
LRPALVSSFRLAQPEVLRRTGEAQRFSDRDKGLQEDRVEHYPAFHCET